MHKQGDAAAGDEAIRHIEHGEIHKIHRDHIHHIPQPLPVDHVTQAACVDGGDAPPVEGFKGHPFAGKLPHNAHSKQDKDQQKQPLHSLKRGKGRAGILGVGQVKQPRDRLHRGMQRDIGHHPKLTELISDDDHRRHHHHQKIHHGNSSKVTYST